MKGAEEKMSAETSGPIVIVYNELADPRESSSGEEVQPHFIRSEIPAIEQVFLEKGWPCLTLPIRDAVLDAASELQKLAPRAVINLCEDILDDSAHEMNFVSLLELLRLPYSGSPPLAVGLCRDKPRTKDIVSRHGLPTPGYAVADSADFPVPDLSFPLIVKPACEDGSLGIDDECVTESENALREKVGELLEYYHRVMIEEFIAGRELNVAILGNSPPATLPVSEIDYSSLPPDCPPICGYEAKWEEENDRYRGTVPLCPAPLTANLRKTIETFSLAAYRLLGLRDYARIDWRLSPARGLQFLEANPNPDISPDSGFIRSLRAAGLDYRQFMEFLVTASEERLQ